MQIAGELPFYSGTALYEIYNKQQKYYQLNSCQVPFYFPRINSMTNIANT